MPVDVNRLNSWLNNSKVQTTNNPLWQLLKAIIGFVQENTVSVDQINTSVPSGGGPENTVLHGATEPLFRQVATADIEDAAITTAKITDANVTYTKIQDVSAISKLLGRGSAAGAGDVEEITLGTNLTMSGTTLNATGGGGGSVTGTGTTGQLAQWSAATALTDVSAAGISAALDLL